MGLDLLFLPSQDSNSQYLAPSWNRRSVPLEPDIYHLSHFPAALPEIVIAPVTHVLCKYNKLVTEAGRIYSTPNSECFLASLLVVIIESSQCKVNSFWIFGKINIWIPFHMKKYSHSHSRTPPSGNQVIMLWRQISFRRNIRSSPSYDRASSVPGFKLRSCVHELTSVLEEGIKRNLIHFSEGHWPFSPLYFSTLFARASCSAIRFPKYISASQTITSMLYRELVSPIPLFSGNLQTTRFYSF